MKTLTKFLLLLWSITFLVTCSDDDSDDDNNPNSPRGKVEITGTSPEYQMWGEVLTITGTGFSPKKEDNFVWLQGVWSCSAYNVTNDSTGWRKAEIVGATATELKIKVPYVPYDPAFSSKACGEDRGLIRITVGGKTAMSNLLYFVETPSMTEIFQNVNYTGAISPGDSAVINASLGLYGAVSDYADKLKLDVDGKNIPLKKIGQSNPYWNLGGRYSIYLPPNEWAEDICSPFLGSYGKPGRPLTFKVYVEGTDKSYERNFDVFSRPVSMVQMVATNTGSTTFKKTDPFQTNPSTIIVKGKNMSFDVVKFTPIGCAGNPPVIEDPVSCNYCNEFTIPIPGNFMEAPCSYKVSAEELCNGDKSLITISVILE